MSDAHLCKPQYVAGRLVNLPVNSAFYTCGDCDGVFTTICQLHDHVQNHDKGGSYYYDDRIKTAFPKFDSACMDTQTCWEDRAKGRRLFRNYLWKSYYYEPKKRGPKTRKRSHNDGDADSGNKDAKKNFRFIKKGKSKYVPTATDIKLLNKTVDDDSFNKMQHMCLDVKVGKHLELSKCYRHQNKDDSSSAQQSEPNQMDGDEVPSEHSDGHSDAGDEKNSEGPNVTTAKDVHVAGQVDSDNDTPEEALLVPALQSSVTDKSVDDTEIDTDKSPRYCETDTGVKIEGLGSSKRRKPTGNAMQYLEKNSEVVERGDHSDGCESSVVKVKHESTDSEYDAEGDIIYDDSDEDFEIYVCKKKAKPTLIPVVEQPTIFHCKTCDMDIPWADKKRHNARHSKQVSRDKGKEKIVCEFCGVSVAACRMDLHRRQKHTGEQPFSCNICGRSFHVRHQLYGHMRTAHLEGKLKCQYCDKRFHQPSLLRKHEIKHTGQQECICPICGVGLRQCSLNLHIKTVHQKLHDYECDVCHKKFSRQQNLVTHKKLHENIQYKCKFCERPFADTKSLRRHEQIHTGEGYHQCHLCEYKCIQIASFYTHMSKKHGYSRDQAKELRKLSKLRESKYFISEDVTKSQIM